ncbi:hypothetical protein ANCCAN_26673 [Ancylostoma caninum]|uniref:Uncharacterized protein n=1 Tax=Ancylostoma caninum TaxID=29170 RepID=A0A368F689_ANCCA|nr:hypothetical protein ANCCAN_26673 [Ancylostoma caninum]
MKTLTAVKANLFGRSQVVGSRAQLSKGDYSDPTGQLDATKTAINEGKLRATCGSPPSDEPSKEFTWSEVSSSGKSAELCRIASL